MSESSLIQRCHISEWTPVHRYQSQHLYIDFRMTTSTQISESSPVHRHQISEWTPVYRSQSHHQDTDIRLNALQRYQIHDQYTHVRVIIFTQLSESSPVDRYQSQHPSSTQMSETSPVQKEIYREKQLACQLHLAFSNINYTYVHFVLWKMHP